MSRVGDRLISRLNLSNQMNLLNSSLETAGRTKVAWGRGGQGDPSVISVIKDYSFWKLTSLAMLIFNSLALLMTSIAYCITLPIGLCTKRLYEPLSGALKSQTKVISTAFTYTFLKWRL